MESHPRILITGETAGTGASTTARLISEQVNIPIISGGMYLRALAFHFQEYKTTATDITSHQQYQKFLNIYEGVYEKEGLAGVVNLFKHHLNHPHQSAVMAEFQGAIAENKSITGHADALWDYLVDKKTLHEALEKEGFVWESKLAVLALHIDQLQPTIPPRALKQKYLSVLLTLDPVIAAQRVALRENRKVDVQEIITRKQRDFDRYGQLYTIKDILVSHNNLQQHADIIIDTQNLKPIEVAEKILTAYQAQSHTIVDKQ